VISHMNNLEIGLFPSFVLSCLFLCVFYVTTVLRLCVTVACVVCLGSSSTMA